MTGAKLVAALRRNSYGTVRRCFLCFVLCLLSSLALAAPPDSVQATYKVSKYFLEVEIKESYTRDQDRYTLSSVWSPVGLLARLKPEKSIIDSTGLIGKQGLQPLLFTHRRERDESKNSRAEFDWGSKQLSLTHQAKSSVVALPDGAQDRLSTWYQFMFIPLQNLSRLDLQITDGHKLDNYHYTVTYHQKITVPAGEFDAIYLDSQARSGENRSQIWLATQYHNLPCKMIVTETNGDVFVQELSKLDFKP